MVPCSIITFVDAYTWLFIYNNKLSTVHNGYSDILDIVIILKLKVCPRANPIQILLVIMISLLDIVIICAQITQEYWIFELPWPP